MQLFLFLAQLHTLLASVSHAITQGGDARFQLTMQVFKIVNVVLFALTLAEIGQQTLGLLLFAQTLFQLIQTAAQRLRLFRQVTLVYAVAQQFTRHVPGFVTRQRSVD